MASIHNSQKWGPEHRLAVESRRQQIRRARRTAETIEKDGRVWLLVKLPDSETIRSKKWKSC
jgi:hypothetical protein